MLKDYPWYISPSHDFNFESAFNKAIEKMDSNALVRKEILNSYSQNNQRAQLQKYYDNKKVIIKNGYFKTHR